MTVRETVEYGPAGDMRRRYAVALDLPSGRVVIVAPIGSTRTDAERLAVELERDPATNEERGG